MSNGTESLFWNESWRGADKQQIEKYIRYFDFKPDAIIGGDEFVESEKSMRCRMRVRSICTKIGYEWV